MGSTQGYEHYDLICLGSGVASKVLAWTIGPIPGKRCAVIERKWLGGSCPNVACMPSKNVIHSAKVADLNAHGYLYGLPKRNASPVDMRAVIQRKDDMVLESSKAHQENFDKAGVDLIWGNGRFIGKRTIEVTNQAGEKRTLTADHVVIDTGSRAAFNKIPGLVEAEPMSHVEMLDLKVVPSHLIIIGGGYVGLEFAQAMRRFGAEVTVLDRNPRILKKEDNDVATDLQETLEAEGVVFSVSTSISQIGGKCGGEVMISGTRAGEKFEIRGSHILYAAGRIPNNDGIGLELAGVEITETGHVKVNEHNETSSEGVFAVGDCANSPHFTHM